MPHSSSTSPNDIENKTTKKATQLPELQKMPHTSSTSPIWHSESLEQISDHMMKTFQEIKEWTDLSTPKYMHPFIKHSTQPTHPFITTKYSSQSSNFSIQQKTTPTTIREHNKQRIVFHRFQCTD